MRFAIYARVSTDAQSQYSTTDQVRQCKAFVGREGGQVVEIYIDEALSGSDVSRAAYQRMKADAYADRFDAIAVDDLSRIGRDMPEFVGFCRDLSDLGVVLHGVADGLDSSMPSAKIPLYLKGMMNELYLDDLKARIVRGLKGQFMRGYSTGGRIFGYKTKQILDPSGVQDKFGRPKRLGCEVLVDEVQAKVVKRIFELKASGLGYKAIAKLLNADGIPSPHAGCGSSSGLWSPATVTGILKNRKYTGLWEYNKTRWIKKPVRGKRRSLPNPKEQWETLSSERLRIVSDRVFEKVNSQPKTARKARSGNKRYLLSGILVCGECGSSMTVVNSGRYSDYVCSGARAIGPEKCGNRRRLPRAVVETSLLSEVRSCLLDSEIISTITKRVNERIGSQQANGQQEISALQDRQQALESQVDRLLTALESGEEVGSIVERLKERERELREVSSRLEALLSVTARSRQITETWVQDRLVGILAQIGRDQTRLPIARNELRTLFAGKLRATPNQSTDRLEFTLTGKVNPYNLGAPDEPYQSIIAVQGLEPRIRSGASMDLVDREQLQMQLSER